MVEKRSTDRTVEEKLSILIASIEKVYPATPKLLWRSFLMGAFGALGASVGLAII